MLSYLIDVITSFLQACYEHIRNRRSYELFRLLRVLQCFLTLVW